MSLIFLEIPRCSALPLVSRGFESRSSSSKILAISDFFLAVILSRLCASLALTFSRASGGISYVQ